MILTIETSCDDTSVALVNPKDGELLDVLSVSQLIHSDYGGVVPELASRKHFSNIMPLLKTILKNNNLELDNISYIAVTYTPGLLGSLLVGVTAAKSLAFSLGVPLIPVHHMEGHLMSVFIENSVPEFPFMSLVISGGHTFITIIKDFHKYEIIGETLDDSAGEAFDKTARVLGLPYPGGPHIEKEALKAFENADIPEFPKPMSKSGDLNFSFSGLKTAVKIYRKKNPEVVPAIIAKGFQEAVASLLQIKLNKALLKYKVKFLTITGGVAANKFICDKLKNELNCNILIPSKKYCTDNAGMIGKAAYYRLKNNFNVLKDKKYFSLNPIASMRINEEKQF
ncbi:MAG: tRNA (adenosine(37)-N6)-threonylcarbamoyltransferase complex transferase subunit TsaD [Candidatus Muiribacteriota bacterium]